ncbi:cathepsin L-like [Watersipora subatra]|uniref:cathepsin L-like n=1 Tax=Watersipora subatra TaxID=2589382 RepID=UPI00355B3CC9
MNLLLLTLLVCTVSASPYRKWYEVQPALDAARNNDGLNIKLKRHWENFKDKYSKSYESEEDSQRFEIFARNYAMIEKHNAEEALGFHTFTLGLNKFADLTRTEIQKRLKGFKMPERFNQTGSTFLEPSVYTEDEYGEDEEVGDLPRSVDWRTEGYVTHVKDQANCGSCYSFSSTGSLEGQHFKKTGQLISLSEQNLVDCSRNYGNNGCDGGLMTNTFNYIKDNHGVDVEQSYPYEAVASACRFNPNNVGATVTGYVELPQGNEKKLKNAVANVGPISVAIDSNHDSFLFYQSGIYYESSCSTTNLDHAVLAVGYGKSKKETYWIVKNSWGPDWGESGFIRMARNVANQCGIATMASYPLV